MTLCIVGAGEMGRWLAGTVDADLAVADTDAAAAREAADAYDAETVPLSDGVPESGRRFDVVCLAVPMPVVAEAVADWAPYTDEGMVDLSGVMAPAVEAMREHLPDCERASLHPLFAPARAPGNVALVADEVGPALESLLADLEAAGNDVFETTSEEHDEAMCTVQAKTHAAVLAWALAGDEVREEFHTPISGGLADLATTVTEGDAHVYDDIQQAFDGAEEIVAAAERVAEAEDESFADLYAEAGAAAEQLGGESR